jgi:hypothetical protein
MGHDQDFDLFYFLFMFIYLFVCLISYLEALDLLVPQQAPLQWSQSLEDQAGHSILATHRFHSCPGALASPCPPGYLFSFGKEK